MTRLYDVSVPVTDGGLIYPGNPDTRFVSQQAISRGDGANVSSLSFGSHTGTHVDAPKHFVDDGATVDQLSLDVLIGRAIVLHFPDSVRVIGEADLRAHDLRGQTRVLLRTRNSALMSQREFVRDYTFLAPEGAEYLVRQGVTLVGIDYLSIEQFRSGHHRTHLALLRAGVVIIEGLDLSAPPAGEYELLCLPLKLAGLDGAPARVVLRAPGA